MRKYDYLLVDATLFESIFSDGLKKRRKKCLVIDKREDISGNIYFKNIEEVLKVIRTELNGA